MFRPTTIISDKGKWAVALLKGGELILELGVERVLSASDREATSIVQGVDRVDVGLRRLANGAAWVAPAAVESLTGEQLEVEEIEEEEEEEEDGVTVTVVSG